jgi:hypothetical protein
VSSSEAVRADAISANATAGTFRSTGTIVLTYELNNDTLSIFAAKYPTIRRDFQHVEPMHVCQNITQPYLTSTRTMLSCVGFAGLCAPPDWIAQYTAGSTTIGAYHGDGVARHLARRPADCDGVGHEPGDVHRRHIGRRPVDWHGRPPGFNGATAGASAAKNNVKAAASRIEPGHGFVGAAGVLFAAAAVGL